MKNSEQKAHNNRTRLPIPPDRAEWLKRLDKIARAARTGDERARRALNLLRRVGCDSNAVFDAYETGALLPKRSYKSAARAEYEQKTQLRPDLRSRSGRLAHPASPAEGERHWEIQCQREGCSSVIMTPTRQLQFCSNRCQRAQRQKEQHDLRKRFEEATLECAEPQCGERIFQLRADHRFCSSRCRNRARRRSGSGHTLRQCEACETPFMPKNSRSRFCSDRCRVRVWERNRTGLL